MTFPVGVATGIGSWPGADPRESAATVVGELGELPHLVELPARGVGADMVGRTGALLVDIDFDTTTRGYRIAARPGAVSSRALDYLREDLDALDEAYERAGSAPTVKVQACGPFTLAAEVELANGHRALTDSGAVRDIAESLAEGLGEHVAQVRRRLGTEVILQLDEPRLPAVLAGSLRGVTGRERIAPIPGAEALELLDRLVERVGGAVAVHNCAAEPPLELLRRSRVSAVGIDVSQMRTAALDEVGELLQREAVLMLGLVPSSQPASVPTWRDVVAPALRLVDRLGFPREILARQIVVTPTCGLAGASQEWARQALRLCADASRALLEEPAAL